ncbi:MAG: MnhB domain-containing protein [Bacteroidales bacterium]
MNSGILQIAEKYLRWLFLIFALTALFRGHNMPGGGFIGGLMAAFIFVFRGFAYSPALVYQSMKIKPETYLVMGFIVILLSFMPVLVPGKTFFEGVWVSFDLPLLGLLKLGTPLLFDIGIFLVVIGVTVLFLFSLNRTY